MRTQPVASVRHLFIFLAIFTGLFLAGLHNAQSSTPVSAATTKSHIPLYLGLIAAEGALLFFIKRGVAEKGGSLAQLAVVPSADGSMPPARPWAAPRILLELIIGLLFAVTLRYLVMFVAAQIGSVDDRTSGLHPRNWEESCLWIALSLAAGICEEFAFRAYLQRQLTAFLGSRIVAVLLQSLFFGMAHGYQGWKQCVVIAFIGLCFTLLTLWRGNIYAAMVGHAATDVAAAFWV